MILKNSESSIKDVLSSLYPNEQFEISKFNSGKTNNIYHCYTPNISLVLKIFGETPFINRVEEIENIEILSLSSRCPPIIKKYNNGYLTKYIPGREVKENELQLKYKIIIAEMKNWHQIKTGAPLLFLRLKDWYIRAYEHHREFLEENKILEIIEAKEKQAKNIFNLEDVGFCHNDLLASNIIINKEQIQFIDFEYASINYIHFDIANHLCEYAGYNCNFRLIPQEKFIKKVVKEYFNGDFDLSLEIIEEHINKIIFFIPLAHIFWGLWGLIKKKDRDFDYEKYGKTKILEGIKKYKEENKHK